MNKITIKIGNRSKEVIAPASWNDLDRRTLMLFYETLFANQGDEFSGTSFTSVKLITMTQTILGADMAFMTKWEADCIREDQESGSVVFLEELTQVLQACLAGLFETKLDDDGNTAYSVKFNLTKNPYPELSHTPKTKGKRKPKTTWVYAPKDELANVTIYELAYAFQLYEAYLQTNDEKHALALIAVLYRPSRPQTIEDRASDWFGDRRQPLRKYEGKIDERAKLADGLPALVKRLLVFWFASCREYIISQWPQVFKKSDGDGGGSSNHWGDLLLSLAETGVFGNLDQTADQHYSNALQLLTKRDNEAKAMEKQLAKTKKK
jgi:hypothetical protein